MIVFVLVLVLILNSYYILLSLVNKFSFIAISIRSKIKKMQKKIVRFILDPNPVLDPQYPRIRIWVLKIWTRGSGFGSIFCSRKQIWIRVHLDPVRIRVVAISIHDKAKKTTFIASKVEACTFDSNITHCPLYYELQPIIGIHLI